MKISCRRLAPIGLAAMATFLLSGALAAERVRPNVDSLSDDQVRVLQAAMKAIKALPDSDPQSYGFLRDTHDSLNGPCEHGSEVFLPWHRELLLRFENALRASGVEGAEDLVLPYWDWSLPPSGERYPKICEDPDSELFHAGRNPPGDPPLPLSDLAKAMAADTWEVFGGKPLPAGGPGKLERPAHNFMHSGYVSGDMRNDFTAARDPLFWLFHNGIDYFWWQWQQEHPDADPADPCYQLRGFGDTTVGDVQDADQLGYRYQASEVEVNLMSEEKKKKRTLLHEGFANRITALDAEPKPFESFSFDFTVPDPGFRQAELQISEVKLAGAGSYIARYYVHPVGEAYAADDEAFKKRYLAATDAHFGGASTAAHGLDHHPRHADVAIDVTDALAKLAPSHAGETWRITAVYEGPRDPETGEPTPVLLGQDVDQDALYLAIDEE